LSTNVWFITSGTGITLSTNVYDWARQVREKIIENSFGGLV
jgi:hypothetical protein